MLQHIPAKPIDDKRHRFLGIEATLLAEKQLVIADFRGRRLMLQYGGEARAADPSARGLALY